MASTEEEKPIDQVLLYPIQLSDRIREVANNAATFHAECTEVGNQTNRINYMLRSVVRFSGSMYERPVRRIAADVSKNLKRALTLVRKCRRRNILRRVVTIVTRADFLKIRSLLEASIGDMIWLLSIFDYDEGGGSIELSLPSIASNDPVLAWVWSFIAAIQFGPLSDRIEAATELASLAQDNDRNKKVIAEEGGVVPLLKLLNHASPPDAQIAAATALVHLANSQERVCLIVEELDIQILVQVLEESPMRVQIWVANLVARLAEQNHSLTAIYRMQNVIRPLVTLLSRNSFVDVRIDKDIEMNSKSNQRRDLSSLSSSSYSKHSSQGGNRKRERDGDNPVVEHKLKISCAEALWMLVSNSKALDCFEDIRILTETKALLCLATLIAKEPGELQFNCLMVIMEITAAAESVDNLRTAFRTNYQATKAVVDQLLRVIKELDMPSLQLPAIRSIGSLARTFPSRETRVISPLVERLSHANQDVATEAAISLGKFTCPENFVCSVQSKAIIEFDGVPPLMRLLRSGGRPQIHGLILLCYLAMHAGDSEALEDARVLTALEGAHRTAAAQHSKLKELLPQAIHRLEIYRAGAHPHIQSYGR
ncbi:Armadillo repeat-containing protein [Actinidia chinensis var. chinensis]|uniref:Armadillo repeat-containing protein n=1 Tax=Actinidia chinensis var. chinensis TaxID=1590841 RepID=A0A2R6RES4_ACTCC|nr:Armadillo repeat-containing protein [Actinidia chinensis var. chinensis]